MAGPAYVWGAWRFEPSESRLLRDGVIVPLPAKSLDLLATLLRRAPRLITKEEILSAVWKDAAVEEGNIAFHVAALRKAIDQEGEPSAIETVRGRGYRFVATMTIHQLPPTDDIRQVVAWLPRKIVNPGTRSEPDAPPARRSIVSVMVMALLLGVVVGAGGFALFRSEVSRLPPVAVEPFEIVNPGPGQENFPDGLGPYLTSRLQLSGLQVAPRERAGAVLSGQLHPIENGFRVTVQLTRPRDNARMWDWSFEQPADEGRPPAGAGPDDERSRIQAHIAGQIAEGVQRYLSLSGDAPVTR